MPNSTGRVAANIGYKDFLTSYKKEVCSPRLIMGDFQRNYVWSRKNIVPLIDAICESEEGYYIGNIVTQRGQGGVITRDIIVDGQQRLITLSFVLLILRSEFKNRDLIKEINSMLFEEVGSQRPRIIFLRSPLKKVYRKIIFGSVKKEDVGNDVLTKKMVSQYNCVRKKVLSIEDLDSFFKKLKKIEFVAIKCSELSDVNQLYEGLNSTGRPLTPVEQTKNLLLGFSNSSFSQSKLIRITWESIESEFEKKNSIWFDKFLRHQFFSIGGYVSSKELYYKIRNYVKSQDEAILNYSKSLKIDGKRYLLLRTGSFNKRDFPEFQNIPNDVIERINYFLVCIRNLGLDQVYALLLSLVKFADKNFSYSSGQVFLRDLEKITSFFILAKYIKINPSRYEKILANFCNDLHKEENKWDKLKQKEFEAVKKRKLFDELKKHIEDRESIFIRNLSSLVRYSNDSNIRHSDGRLVRMLLSMFLTKEGHMIPGESTTIEHIVPEKDLDKYWKNIDEKFKKDIEQIWRYRLGNLTLIKEKSKKIRSLNTRIGNKDFDFKYVEAYKGSSGYQINKSLIKYRDDFNSPDPGEAIRKRGHEIASKIYSRLLKNLTS